MGDLSDKIVLEELENTLKEWISTPIGRRSFVAAAPVLLAGCARKKHRYREGDNKGQKTSITVADEKKMTKEYLAKMKKDYPPVKNKEMQSYINGIGQKIVKKNKLHKKPYSYSFTVVEVPYVNAFALPAGTVYVTAPLIAMADNEAELAGVIGHEIGHVKARHTAERIDKAKKEQSKSILYTIGGGLLGGAAGFGLGKALCPKNDKKCLKNATLLGAGTGAAGGLLIQKYWFMANSQEDEMEADRIGFRTSNIAGYHKDHVGGFYSKLLKMEEGRKKGVPILGAFQDAMSTHPPSRERVIQMNQMAREVKSSKGAVISTKQFDKMKKLAQKFSKKA